MKLFLAYTRAAAALVLLMTLLLGGIYPLLVTALNQMVFHHKANGSLIERGGKIVGSTLLGQSFEEPGYFWGRLSATSPAYNAAVSASSNLSPANPKLLKIANARIAALQKASPGSRKLIPVDLITASGSGLDPDISLSAAEYQLPRVARARGLKESAVQALLNDYTARPLAGLGGGAYVNVVLLNLALDDMAEETRKEKR